MSVQSDGSLFPLTAGKFFRPSHSGESNEASAVLSCPGTDISKRRVKGYKEEPFEGNKKSICEQGTMCADTVGQMQFIYLSFRVRLKSFLK